MNSAGIDPGMQGAIVVLSAQGSVMRKFLQPIVTTPAKRKELDPHGMLAILLQIPVPFKVWLEKLHPMPASMGGGIANFGRGRAYSLWEGMLVALGIPYRTVTPQKWQKVMLKDAKGADTKEKSIDAAKRRWPDQDWRRTQQCKKDHDGLTDAANLAAYGIEQEGKE